MADFKCEDGKVLTTAEVEQMLAYDEAGQPRPDAYNNVVFDASSPSGSVYRCSSKEERAVNRKMLGLDDDTAERREKLRLGVLKEAGIDPDTGGAIRGVRAVDGAPAVADRANVSAGTPTTNAGGANTRS